MKYILYKGFIGIDGISLTVGEVTATRFCVHLIPETLQRTTLGAKNWAIASILRLIRRPGGCRYGRTRAGRERDGG
nr:Riboflavin synthase alpha chain [Klebsiella pneumoniae]